jgi:hypothetical protein
MFINCTHFNTKGSELSMIDNTNTDPVIPAGTPGIVAGPTLKNWIKTWWNWSFSFEENHHPSLGSTYEYPRPCDHHQGMQPHSIPSIIQLPRELRTRVWFLAGSYSGEGRVVRSIISEGYDHILVPVYVMGAARDEFPYQTDSQLKTIADNDVSTVSNMIVTFDGRDLRNGPEPIYKRDASFTGLFQIDHMPEENMLGAESNTTYMFSSGYWLVLDDRDLTPGDHSLRIRGESKVYTTDTTFFLTVTGSRPSKRQSTRHRTSPKIRPSKIRSTKK